MAAGSTSASASASSRRRDLINVARLVDRLETAQMADAGQTGEDTAYYHAMATLSSIAYARQVLERASSSSPGQDAGAAQQWSRLAHRLDDVEARFKASAEPILRAARTAINGDHDYNTAEVLARLRPTPVVLAPAVTNVERTASAALSSIRAADSTESAPTPSDLLLPLGDDDEQAQPPASAPTARQSREASSPSLSAQPAPAQGMSTLLSHHRSEQDSLTDELASMASRLKANSLAFADMLSKDRDLMDSAEKKLEGNLDGMTRERERLKGYTKKGGVTTWFVIGSVVAVLLAWLFMFGLMRIA